MGSDTRIGIALGAGAATGIGWDIGVLKALKDEIGLDLSNTSAIYGTSAGSWVGARVLSGRSLDDLAEEQLGNRPQAAPNQGAGSTVSGDGAAAPTPPRGGGSMIAIGLWRATLEMDQGRLKEIGLAAVSDKPVLGEEAWLSLCGTGLPSSEWPEQNFGICSVCCETGERTFWKRNDGVDLLRAMAASCSIPSIFPSIEIGGFHYMDGGVWSGGNCDYLLDEDLDVSIFIGSMLGSTPIGRIASAALESEKKQFAERGLELFTITPGPDFWGEGSSMDPNSRGAALEAGLEAGKKAAGQLKSLF